MKRFLYLLCALAFCLALTPSTALAAAPDGQVIYVGNENVTSGGYWTTGSDGTVTQYTGPDMPADNYVHYDADTNTLTLHNATIKKGLDYDQNPPASALIAGSAIGVFNQRGDAELTIHLEGTNTIAEVFNGIHVLAYSTGGATLTITGDGSLDASAIQTGIWFQSNNGDAALFIQNAKVEATGTSYGVRVQPHGSSTAALTVDGGSLTASGSLGILYDSIGSDTVPNTTALTISNSAIVDARGGGIGAGSLQDLKEVSPAGDSVGIVFGLDLSDSKAGTVYGDVTLGESLTVGEGETLTIPEGSTLDTNGNLTNDGVIVNTGGTLKGEPGGTIVSAPTITKQPESQTVDEGETAKFTVEATGGNLSYQWQQSTDGADWTDIRGANSYTYTTEAATTDMNGRQYRCKVRNNAGSVTSNAATLTVNQHEHEWGEPAWAWSEDGKTANATFICKNDASHTQTVTATVTPTVTTDPTCTGNGTTAYTATATLDGKDYTATKDVADIPATGHELTGVAAKAPTCTEDGYEAYWKCERCGRYFSDADGKNEIQAPTVIKATGHDWGEPAWTWNGTKATAKFTCKNDASHTQVRNATVTSTVKKAPTDTENGVTEYKATVTFGGKTYTAVRDLADIPATGPEWDEDDFVQVLRLYNPYSGEHLYTMDEVEYAHLVSIGWNGEDLAFYARPKDGSMGGYEVYRLYNRYSGRHHLTASVTERDALVRMGWTCEGVAFRYSDEDPTIWRGYNQYADDHLWTTDRHELDVAVSNGWNDEGIAYGVGAKTDVD